MRSLILIFMLVALCVPLAGCASKGATASQAYHVDGQGTVSKAARSATDGNMDPGKQEILGIYLPFIGTGLAVKAGLEWDGMPGTVTVPIGGMGALPPQQAVMVPQRVMMEQTTMVPQMQSMGPCAPAQQVMVPQKTWVPAARMVPLPIPQATTGCK